MKLTSLPHIYRNLNRVTEIVSVLSKFGLADWLSRLHVDFAKGLLRDRDGAALARHTREVRIRMAMSELGPTFVKLGQILSTRPDLVGRDLATELTKLQDAVPADRPEVIREIVHTELGQGVDELFDNFDDTPLASASIGQVHAATFRGAAVVVKVQHARIQERIRVDLDVLAGLAQLAQRIPEFAPYRPVATVMELQRTLRRELDFGRELRNLELFAVRLADQPGVRIPRTFPDVSSARVLTMERLQGIKLSELQRQPELIDNGPQLARYGAELYLKMVFGEGIYHADPHPGNLMILSDNVLGLLDFGMVGRIDERLREDIEDMLFAIVNNDPAYLSQLIVRLGSPPPNLDRAALEADVADFVSLYTARSLERFDMGQALAELTEMIFRYRIQLPPQIAMLLKLLVTLEGTVQLLQPDFSLLEVIVPYQRKAWLRRLSPARRIKKWRRIYADLEHLLEGFPNRLSDILEQVQSGKFDVHLDHRGLEPSVNRLALGLLTSALFMGSALMLSQQVPPLLFPTVAVFGLYRLSLLGLIGMGLSGFLGMRLLRAIGKSGHLERRKSV